MPRRKELKFNISKLDCADRIIEELEGYSEFENYDFSTLTFTVKKNKAPAKIKDVDKVIQTLIRYEVANRHSIKKIDGLQAISKKDLARIMKISRPTLDKWIKSRFIRRPNLFSGSYQISEVLEQLKNYKK